MAANIEQIFQDFILNKIREIEDQNDDNTASEGLAAGGGMAAAEKSPVDGDKKEESRERSSQKKHKKHKKHKSKKKKKKKKKNREKDVKDSDSESEAELEQRSKHQARGGTPAAEKKQGDDDESRSGKHSAPKKKKKKKRKRKDEGRGDSSDSDSESSSRQEGSTGGQKSTPPRREDLPDIIPKQDSSSKGNGDEQRHGKRSCRSRSRSHSHTRSHSFSLRKKSRSRSRDHPPTSGTRSPSNSKDPEASAGSSERRGAPDPPAQSPSKDLQRTSGLTGEKVEQNVEQRIRPEEGPEQHSTQPSAAGCAATHSSSPSQAASSGPDPTAELHLPESTSAKSNKSAPHKRRKASTSPPRDRDKKSSKRQKRSRTPSKSHRTRSRSRSPSRKRRSRSRSRARRSRRSRTRSRSASRSRRRVTYSQRDRWKREPSHSPVLILRKKRSPPRKHDAPARSPQRISELDKEQLLAIAKANAGAMLAKAGMPIPANLRSSVLPLALPTMAMNAAMASMTAATMTAALSNMGTLSSLLPLPSITNKPPPLPAQPNMAALEEVKRKVAKQANSISIKEFTDKCKMIVDSKGELPVAVPHVSDEEDDGKPFGGSALREQKAISFNINSAAVRPAVRSDAGMAKEFPVSSGSQHRKKEGEALGAYGEWVPVEKGGDDAAAAAALRRALSSAPAATPVSSAESCTAAGQLAEPPDHDSVFPDPPPQPVDISQAVTERIKAQRRLAENPYDVNAICMLSRAQEQVDAWAQSNTVPGLFTGSTGAQVLSSEELSNSGPQAWLKKDQFLRAAPVSGGVGEFLMRKMGWRTGEGLGRNREGTVEPIIIDFKVDRKGLVAEGEKPQKQTGGLVVTKDLMGKHPVSALIELCNKRRIMQPDFVMVHHSGPDHRKNFLFKVTVNGVDYQPQTASPNKKHAKAMAATVALQALGEVPVDGPGLYTGPVFTAASTGPLFST